MNRKQSSAFDYITIKTIGQGSFGKVFLVKNRHETIKTLHNASKNSSISCDHPCHGKNEKFSLLHRKQNSSHLFVMKQIPIGHLSKKEQESSVKEAIILSKMNHRLVSHGLKYSFSKSILLHFGTNIFSIFLLHSWQNKKMHSSMVCSEIFVSILIPSLLKGKATVFVMIVSYI